MAEERLMRPEELPFEVPKQLADDINAYLDAHEKGDYRFIDCLIDEIASSARFLDEEHDRWIYDYYCRGRAW